AGGVEDVEGIVPQMKATPGMPERQAVARRQERVRHILHTLPEAAQQAILESFEHENTMSDFIGSEAPTTVLPRVAL
ncbi:ABC transporter ATP-binding protein, partial [Rhodococcus aetherivorans]